MSRARTRHPQLNRRLVLEESQQSPDGAGGFAESWTALGEVWAEVQPRTGRQQDGGAVPVGSVSYRITLRGAPFGSPSRPRPDQRFREGARVFRILAVADGDPADRYVTCFANEETPT
ncbi:head-tail adaptor protein [Shimia biformata]|uniref:head-tail adaptor protein n=1 Tax=Shimia biformata TaxID=1294299 RepID=UPI001951CFFB|nr:head-tail adaptor protein [Shimia biformata]